MAYVYANADALDKTPLVGSHSCVALVQTYSKAPNTSLWKEGAHVFGNTKIAKGTAIATFVNGKYPNMPTGNHAAFYVGQDASGIWVVDQWKSKKKTQVNKRHLSRKGKNVNGAYLDPSNNADAFSVIE